MKIDMALICNRVLMSRKLDKLNSLTRSLSFSVSLKTNTDNSEIQSTVTLRDGKKLILSAGKFARMADGAAVVQAGDTAVMVTAVSKHQTHPQQFLPLSVDFKMKYAAAGRIPMNHFRREMGPSERETLTARVIDRSIRPLFPQNYFSQVNIVSNLLAVDGIHDPEILCINAASLALALSDIPWNGPVGAVRVGMCGKDVLINPTRQELLESSLNLIVSGKVSSKVVMLEAGCENITMNDLMHAISVGLSETQTIINVIQQMADKYGKPKQQYETKSINPDILNIIRSAARERLSNILLDASYNKQSRDKAVSTLRNDVLNEVNSDNLRDMDEVVHGIEYVFKEVFRDLIFERNIRCDGRALNDIRPIACGVNLYKPLHGSAVFQRGQTQVLCTVALDSPQSAVKMDEYSILTSGIKEKSFFLHYEFPSYATNEISSSRGLNRREVGHGALAEKGLRPVVPKDFPFCIRLTSEVLESNGSSSMAAICGGSMALLDAGVPLMDVVAGVAIGLITRSDEKNNIIDHRILTDILGMEDYMGDMDFKVAGSKTGFTALQMDIKVPGISVSIIHEALVQAQAAKGKILSIMKKCINQPSIKEANKPLVEIFEVPPHKRTKLTGPGHINLKKLFVQTGVQITPLEDLRFSAFAPNEAAMEEAYDIVRRLMETENEPTFDFGAIYAAKIVELREGGITVSLHPKIMPVFIPNSQLDTRKISHPSALGLQVGEKISVKYFGRDPASGTIRLSRRALQGHSGPIRDFDKYSPSSIPILKDDGKSVITGTNDSKVNSES